MGASSESDGIKECVEVVDIHRAPGRLASDRTSKPSSTRHPHPQEMSDCGGCCSFVRLQVRASRDSHTTAAREGVYVDGERAREQEGEIADAPKGRDGRGAGRIRKLGCAGSVRVYPPARCWPDRVDHVERDGFHSRRSLGWSDEWRATRPGREDSSSGILVRLGARSQHIHLPLLPSASASIIAMLHAMSSGVS